MTEATGIMVTFSPDEENGTAVLTVTGELELVGEIADGVHGALTVLFGNEARVAIETGDVSTVA